MAMSCIEVGGDSLLTLNSVLIRGEALEFEFTRPLLEHGLGHGVVEAKGDCLDEVRAVEMREVIAGVPAFGGGHDGAGSVAGSADVLNRQSRDGEWSF